MRMVLSTIMRHSQIFIFGQRLLGRSMWSSPESIKRIWMITTLVMLVRKIRERRWSSLSLLLSLLFYSFFSRRGISHGALYIDHFSGDILHILGWYIISIIKGAGSRRHSIFLGRIDKIDSFHKIGKWFLKPLQMCLVMATTKYGFCVVMGVCAMLPCSLWDSPCIECHETHSTIAIQNCM